MEIEIKIVAAWEGWRLTEMGHRATFQGDKIILCLDEGVGFCGGVHLSSFTKLYT